jgi:hypothetical protein
MSLGAAFLLRAQPLLLPHSCEAAYTQFGLR